MEGPESGAGAARSACRERHVLKMLSMVLCAENCGGLTGGEAKRADCRRVSGGCDGCDGCDESQDKAEGSNMLANDAKAYVGCPDMIGR